MVLKKATMILSARAAMIADVFGGEGLVRRIRVGPDSDYRLLDSARDYIFKAADIYGVKYPQYTNGSLGASSLEVVTKLPNVTPNGAVKPKRELLGEYRLFFLNVLSIFKQVVYPPDYFSYASLPQLRYVSGASDPEKEKRPYATTKLHSEFWVGQTFDLNCLVPILGDTERTTLKFYVPCGYIDEGCFTSKHDDYTEHLKSAFEYAEPIQLDFQIGHLYVHDNYILHKTVKNGGGDRLSVDFGLLYKGREPGEHNPETIYLPIDKWIEADLSGIEFPSVHDAV